MGELKLGGGLRVGAVNTPGKVWIAPMTGVTDLPFRQTASRLGAPYVATEMVACAALVAARPDIVRRAAVGEGLPLMVVQLVGHDPNLIAAGVAVAARAGADVVDLNFGCPAKEVTGHRCGSALMRDLDLAEEIVGAAASAAGVPVTVKMRLGWDEHSLNAPELARRAQAAGAMAVTVHARTRRQFYAGVADWTAVAAVKAAVAIPVLVNGDIVDVASARAALTRSGADGVMIGRAAVGRPWLAGVLQADLEGRSIDEPSWAERLSIVGEHLAASVRFHGAGLGLRMFRKHLAAYVEAAPWPTAPPERRRARAALCRLESETEIGRALAGLWAPGGERLAA